MKKQIGNIIRKFRIACGLKQSYMAYNLKISTNAYANIEQGRSEVSARKLHLIANLFGIKIYQIFVLAEELKQHGDLDAFNDAIDGIFRLSRIDLNKAELTCQDQFLLAMDSGIRRLTFEKV